MSITIKDILFNYINQTEGHVNYEEITEIILSSKPSSKWKLTHWNWYKTHIISPKGKFYNLFPDNIKENISNSRVQNKKGRIKIYSVSTTSLKPFKYIDNSNLVERELAIILGRVSHHIHPKIVSRITEENILFEKDFKVNCHPALNTKDYFYEGSDCLFPGIRRPINKEKDGIKKWKNKINEVDGTIFNDNTYPRHIWTYLSMNKGYSGGTNGTWGKSGLDAFELAHIFGHKVDEKELEKSIFKEFDDNFRPYSLFTSASNVVLIPKGLTKPTDKMNSIKICFYKRHLDLYGNNLNGLNKFDEEQVPHWYNDIEWIEPIIPDDWENRINNLLKYRKQHLINKYSNYKNTTNV